MKAISEPVSSAIPLGKTEFTIKNVRNFGEWEFHFVDEPHKGGGDFRGREFAKRYRPGLIKAAKKDGSTDVYLDILEGNKTLDTPVYYKIYVNNILGTKLVQQGQFYADGKIHWKNIVKVNTGNDKYLIGDSTYTAFAYCDQEHTLPLGNTPSFALKHKTKLSDIDKYYFYDDLVGPGTSQLAHASSGGCGPIPRAFVFRHYRHRSPSPDVAFIPFRIPTIAW